jgi:cytoskeletal protein RodZ
MAECIEYTGPFLKQIREYKNVTIERLAEMTRISKTHITAIENEDIPKLPADVYVRGYVYQVAKVLKLNPEQVASSFMVYFKKLKTQK